MRDVFSNTPGEDEIKDAPADPPPEHLPGGGPDPDVDVFDDGSIRLRDTDSDAWLRSSRVDTLFDMV